MRCHREPWSADGTGGFGKVDKAGTMSLEGDLPHAAPSFSLESWPTSHAGHKLVPVSQAAVWYRRDFLWPDNCRDSPQQWWNREVPLFPRQKKEKPHSIPGSRDSTLYCLGCLLPTPRVKGWDVWLKDDSNGGAEIMHLIFSSTSPSGRRGVMKAEVS